MRYINLSNEKKRNAQVLFKSAPSSSKIFMVNVDDKKPLTNKRLLKFSSKNSLHSLLHQFRDSEQLSNALIKDDPEIDLELTGKFLEDTAASINQVDENIRFDENIDTVVRISCCFSRFFKKWRIRKVHSLSEKPSK